LSDREGADGLERRILRNEALVQRILESAEHLSEPMNAEQFMAWLGNPAHDIIIEPGPDARDGQHAQEVMENEQGSTTQALTEDERRYIERARTDKFENGGIVRYYEQALRNGAHEDVLAAIELRMRSDFPREARKVFGARGDLAEQMLSRVREAVLQQFDLGGNGLGNHIKVGGDERRTGDAYLYRYLSYRASGQQYGAQLALIQDTPATELRVMVRYSRVYAGADNIDERQWFAAGDIGQAQEAYLALLDKLAVPRRAGPA
jgi:hypothetical protein